MNVTTTSLRLLLGALVLAIALTCGWIYLYSLESAQSWPQLAHLRVPLYLAVVAGFVPVLAAVTQVFVVLGLIDRGEAFSPQSLRALRRTRGLAAVFAAYLAVGFVSFWAVLGLMHITLLLAWFVTEVAAVAVLTVLGRVERTFAEALVLRRDVELTV